MTGKTVPQDMLDKNYKMIQLSLRYVEDYFLSNDRKYMFADLPSIADISLFNEIIQLTCYGFTFEKTYPKAHRFLKIMQEMHEVKQNTQDGTKLIKQFYENQQ